MPRFERRTESTNTYLPTESTTTQADNARLREERRAAVTATAELRARNARVERELESLKKREAVASRARAALLTQVRLGSGSYRGGWCVGAAGAD